MNTSINPTGLGSPAANYALGMLSEAGSRLIHTAGIVPTRPDGTVPADLAEQADVIWAAISAVMHAGAMTLSDVITVTTYVVLGNDLAVVMAARDSALAGHKAASTLITVPALARPEWKMEIAVVAAAF